MGTSTGYKAPTSPQWKDLKSDVTRAAPDGRPAPAVSQRLVREFVEAAGGPRRIAAGDGSVGRNGAAQRVAVGIAGFASTVAQVGLPAALREFELDALIGRPISEILDALVDRLGGSASSLDDVDARNALSELREELFRDVQTAEELEAKLVDVLNADLLAELLMRFFAFCIFEQFTRVFYERLVAKVGDAVAASFLAGIKDYILSAVKSVGRGRNLNDITWDSQQGRELADRILEDTLYVFAGI